MITELEWILKIKETVASNLSPEELFHYKIHKSKNRPNFRPYNFLNQPHFIAGLFKEYKVKLMIFPFTL